VREGQRLGEHVTLGVLTRFVPADVVDAVLRDTGRVAWRARLYAPDPGRADRTSSAGARHRHR
jgi:hypothetical protein